MSSAPALDGIPATGSAPAGSAPADAPAGPLARLAAWAGAPVSLQSLAVTRILFGAIMVWDCWRFIRHDRIHRYYVEPEHLFPFFGLDWIRPLPEPWIHLAWLSVGVCAFLVMVGLFFRVAILGFLVVFTYFFLLDRTQYLNHFYMVILYAALLAVSPAHRMFSLDALRRPEAAAGLGPRWPLAALRLQTEIILIYAGLVKITPDWLAGEPLGMWVRERPEAVFFGFLFQFDWAILLGAWGTIVLHVLGAPLLLWKRTRLPVFLVYCAFHMSNAALFNIGIFPWLTIAVTLVFFEPDWPGRLARRAAGLLRLPLADPSAAPVPSAFPPAGRPVLLGLALWFALQLLLPVREAAFPTDVHWTGDGHRFSWRMRIHDRQARGHFEVVAPSGERWRVDPRDWLARRQVSVMLTRPDMIHDFARLLARHWEAAGHPGVAVHAHVVKSLNGRAFQPFTDPQVDLVRAGYDYFGPVTWILPLETPLAPLRPGLVSVR